MDMKNKEQLLYFFLQGKISLSQYDYKFMANLQTMIQNQNRVTSNQATLFDNLISKYKKQLTKNGLVKEELKALPWKTMIVESTSEYTGAAVSLMNDEIHIRVPFNKAFISEFRNISNNNFEWRKDTKMYVAPFCTTALKVANKTLPNFFKTVRYDNELQAILDELDQYKNLTWNPTLVKVNDQLVISAMNSVLGELIKDMKLSLDPKTLFELSQLHISIDQSLIEDSKLKFAASTVYEAEITELETIISWMKNIGCENVIIGRGLRNVVSTDSLTPIIEKYGMNALGPISYGSLPTGVSMLIQHTSQVDARTMFGGNVSKTVVIRDSRPIEVK